MGVYVGVRLLIETAMVLGFGFGLSDLAASWLPMRFRV